MDPPDIPNSPSLPSPLPTHVGFEFAAIRAWIQIQTKTEQNHARAQSELLEAAEYGAGETPRYSE